VTPLAHFNLVWNRCAELSAIQAYIFNNVAPILSADELLRAEWATRVSALDLYVHELVAQEMLATFEGQRPASAAFRRFRISNETLERIRAAARPSDASSAFDLEVRTQLAIASFQDPEKIAEAVRLISDIELWNEVALTLGATQATKANQAKNVKKVLSLMVQRRNKIVHEGDLQPSPPRLPWPISQADVAAVTSHIETIVYAINAVLSPRVVGRG
jgi:hypothetical protein